MENGHGGARPGSGRRKGGKNARTIAREAARDYLSQRVQAEIEPLVTAHLEAAKGLQYFFGKTPDGQWVRVTDPDMVLACLQAGEGFRISAKDPDTRALKDILDREFGRPTEHLELSGEDGGPVRVKFVGLDSDS